jgi:hypothetical protein
MVGTITGKTREKAKERSKNLKLAGTKERKKMNISWW